MNDERLQRAAKDGHLDERRAAFDLDVEAPRAAESGVYLRQDVLPKRPPRGLRERGWGALPWFRRWRVSTSPFPTVIFVRATGAIVAANDATVRAYGWSRDALLASSIADLVPPAGRVLDRLLRHSHSDVTWTEPLLHQRKDGTTFSAELGLLETGVTNSATMAVVVRVREPRLEA